MAEYCKQCAEEHLGITDCDDLAGIVPEGKLASVVCEGCGNCLVDSEGICQHTEEDHFRIWNEDDYAPDDEWADDDDEDEWADEGHWDDYPVDTDEVW